MKGEKKPELLILFSPLCYVDGCRYLDGSITFWLLCTCCRCLTAIDHGFGLGFSSVLFSCYRFCIGTVYSFMSLVRILVAAETW
ncbi:unnamed protein product [Lathyrus sativus]|nr:unnamed protein product [Lathyrus sativus]